MTGDCHVRFCERRGVRFPPATHPGLTRRSCVSTGAALRETGSWTHETPQFVQSASRTDGRPDASLVPTAELRRAESLGNGRYCAGERNRKE
jgi:hypothetical protein